MAGLEEPEAASRPFNMGRSPDPTRYYGVPFYQDAGKGKYCMWLVNKVEFLCSKIVLMDSR